MKKEGGSSGAGSFTFPLEEERPGLNIFAGALKSWSVKFFQGFKEVEP